MNGEIGIGWIIFLLVAAGLGYGWKGVLWSIVGMYMAAFVIFPITLAVTKRILRK